MRAVRVHITDEELAERRSKGLDRWDEMWEGVLHMTPAPSVEHQRIVDEVMIFLGGRMRVTGRGTVRSSINVFRGPRDYRIPDLTFVAAFHADRLHEDGVHGGPDAVVEVRSPDDETYHKLAFYAAIAVGEAIVIDRDTKRPEIYRLAGAQYVVLQADDDGRVRSDTMRVAFGASDGVPGRLSVSDVDDPSAGVEI